MGDEKVDNKNREEFIFENLEVYKQALEFSVEIAKEASKFPIKFQRIRDQIIGASISIPLNIAEGNGRGSSKEKINFYKIARASSFECIPLLVICEELELFSEEQSTKYRMTVAKISRMISGLISYQKAR